MAESSIPVDLLNPGQVFACLGFMEAAEVLLGDARGGFDWSDEANIRFHMDAGADTHPIDTVLEFLLSAERVSVSPIEDVVERDGWNTIHTVGTSSSDPYNRGGKLQNALLPIVLHKGSRQLTVDYWANQGSGKTNLSLWTATNNNGARSRFEKLLIAAKQAVLQNSEFSNDPFNVGAPVAANFRLEMRRNWVSLDLGFSPDKLNKGPKALHLDIMTFPFVEILAAIGLGASRPVRSSSNKLLWTYFAWADQLVPCLARAAMCNRLICSQREFHMYLEEPNDGGDLSISRAYEVTV